MFSQGGDGGSGRLLGRVEEGQEALDHKISLVLDHITDAGLIDGHGAGGHDQHAESVGVVAARHLLQALALGVVQRAGRLTVAHGGGDGQHLFDRALADQHLAAVVIVLDHDGQAATHEVERQFVDLAIGARGGQGVGTTVGEIDDGPVHQVLDPALMTAVQPGQLQHTVIGCARQVEVMRQDDPVLGQCAGLVRAQNIHGAEVLNGVQAFHHHLAARHGHGALGQVGRHDHRQHFRGQPDRDGQGEQEGVHPVALGEAVHQQHDGNHHQHEADQQPADAVDAPVERCLGARPDDGLGQ